MIKIWNSKGKLNIQDIYDSSQPKCLAPHIGSAWYQKLRGSPVTRLNTKNSLGQLQLEIINNNLGGKEMEKIFLRHFLVKMILFFRNLKRVSETRIKVETFLLSS